MRAAGRNQISICCELGDCLAVVLRHPFDRIRLQFANIAPSGAEVGTSALLYRDPHEPVSHRRVRVRLLGRGGMGSVYLARRADDAFRKHVAIKILRSDAASSGAVFVQFHDLFSHAQYDKICSIYEPSTHPSGLSCEESLEWRRVRLGPFKYTNQTSFAGRFNGKLTQIELRYTTRYENGEGAESFARDIREGRAKLTSYGVVSDALSK